MSPPNGWVEAMLILLSILIVIPAFAKCSKKLMKALSAIGKEIMKMKKIILKAVGRINKANALAAGAGITIAAG